MNAGLFSVLGFLVNLCVTSGNEIYTSIHWAAQNPLFIADGDICDRGPRHLKVELQSRVYFICPNTATVLQKSSVGVQTANMYENLWILYNKTVFDGCDTSLEGENKTSRLLLQCNAPTKLTYFPVLFAQYTAEQNGLTFEGGRTYYFIATSDGTESHINDTSRGHCADTSNNIYMKIEVYVCKKSNQTYQDPECKTGLGKLECPRVPTVTPTSSTVKSTEPSGPSSSVSTQNIPQPPKQEKLLNAQNGANNEGKWKTVALFCVALFCLQIIVGLIVYIICRKKICHRRCSSKITQNEQRNEVEVNSVRCALDNPIHPGADDVN